MFRWNHICQFFSLKYSLLLDRQKKKQTDLRKVEYRTSLCLELRLEETTNFHFKNERLSIKLIQLHSEQLHFTWLIEIYI